MQKQDLSKLQTRKMKGLRKRKGAVVTEDQDAQAPKVAKAEGWGVVTAFRGPSLICCWLPDVTPSVRLTMCSSCIYCWGSMWWASRRRGWRPILKFVGFFFSCNFQAACLGFRELQPDEASFRRLLSCPSWIIKKYNKMTGNIDFQGNKHPLNYVRAWIFALPSIQYVVSLMTVSSTHGLLWLIMVFAFLFIATGKLHGFHGKPVFLLREVQIKWFQWPSFIVDLEWLCV